MIESTTTTPSDFYSGSRILLEGIIDEFLSCIGMIRRYQKSQTGWDPISSSTSRVKSPESMREKLIRDGLEPTLQNALAHEHDAAACASSARWWTMFTAPPSSSARFRT